VSMRLLFEKILLVVSHILMKTSISVLSRGVTVGPKVFFRGLSIVDCRNGATISIGAGTVINSRNFGYHLNMFASCKLMSDRKNARLIIGKNCRIHGAAIHAQDLIEIGDNCLFAANCQIFDCNAHELCFDDPSQRLNSIGIPKPVKIGNSVWIGAGAMILPGVTIGDGAVIAAGAIVRDDVPPLSIAVGNPASVVRRSKTFKEPNQLEIPDQ
jgi:acetyltransferase-like isoleucine patch superfamily enzyme